jgi:hypothetical protein
MLALARAPVARSSGVVCDRNDLDFEFSNLVDEIEGKLEQHEWPMTLSGHGISLGSFGDASDSPFDFAHTRELLCRCARGNRLPPPEAPPWRRGGS